MATVEIAGVTLVNVHEESACAGRACVIHSPSNHHMSSMQLQWRDDRGIFERKCPHGTGHPDPDQFDHWLATGQMWQSTHGCCGCCIPKIEGVEE